MRCRLTLAVVAAFVGGSSIAAHAQAPAVVIPGAGVPGTGISNGAGAAGQGAGTGIGTGVGAAGRGAGTGGTASGVECHWRYLGHDPRWDRRSSR